MLDQQYFFIHDDIFDRIQSTHQDKFSCGSLYQMNQMKMNLIMKQQRYVIKNPKEEDDYYQKTTQAYSPEKEGEYLG